MSSSFEFNISTLAFPSNKPSTGPLLVLLVLFDDGLPPGALENNGEELLLVDDLVAENDGAL